MNVASGGARERARDGQGKVVRHHRVRCLAHTDGRHTEAEEARAMLESSSRSDVRSATSGRTTSRSFCLLCPVDYGRRR